MKHVILIAILLICTFQHAYADDEYAFILKARGNPYWQAVVDGLNETARSNGINASIYQIADEIAAEEQLNVCMAALTKHPIFLAISSVTSSIGLICMKRAVAQGTIVADMDMNILPADAEKAKFKLAFSVGSDNYLIGKNAAEYLKRSTAKPDPKILVLEGSVGSIPGEKRAKGFKDSIQRILPKARIIASISAGWDRLKAMNATTDTLQREPSLDVIYAANDLMALGAVEAIRVAGKQNQVTIIGVDGTADGRKAVLDGNMTATVAQLPYLIGKRAIEKAIASTHAQTTEAVEVTPTPVLDRSLLKANNDPLLQYVR
jgi:D-allose transport system substrate-binding protein